MSAADIQQLSPESILDAERFMDYERDAAHSPLVGALLERIDRPGLRICDVGGASGVFLAEIARRSPHAIEGTVLEVNEEYRDRLVDPSLHFAAQSILDNDLPDGSFDLVTFRHILHHLVGESVEETLALQRRALDELLRVTRPGGCVVFQEQVHFVRPFSRAVYTLSKWANRHRVRIRYFETGTVVISFLTPNELASMVDPHVSSGHCTVSEHRLTRRTVAWRWKLTLLMSRVGDALYVLQKPA